MLIEVVGEVLGDKAIEKCAEYVLLEVPTIDASTEVVGNLPDCLVQFCSFYVSHFSVSPIERLFLEFERV